MDINEFRVGNLVYLPHKDRDERGEHIIEEITGNKLVLNELFFSHDGRPVIDINDVKPISVLDTLRYWTVFGCPSGDIKYLGPNEHSEEGFEMDNILFIVGFEGVDIFRRNNPDIKIETHFYPVPEISYVCTVQYKHQLQNVYFMLTGREIDISQN